MSGIFFFPLSDFSLFHTTPLPPLFLTMWQKPELKTKTSFCLTHVRIVLAVIKKIKAKYGNCRYYK